MCLFESKALIYKTNFSEALLFLCLVCSLRDDAIPSALGPVHLPLPADVAAGSGHVLHGPPAPAANVRGAGGVAGRLPSAHEATVVGLLDMAYHAMTGTKHRGSNGASLIFSHLSTISEGAQASLHLSHIRQGLCLLRVVLDRTRSGEGKA